MTERSQTKNGTSILATVRKTSKRAHRAGSAPRAGHNQIHSAFSIFGISVVCGVPRIFGVRLVPVESSRG